MSEVFNPVVPGAESVLPEAAKGLSRDYAYIYSIRYGRPVYYGETPEDAPVSSRLNAPEGAYSYEDDSGETKISALISGDLKSAKKILITSMAWSDHPGRGFEALRELLSANDEMAVLGISFPGAGVTESAMTPKQKEALLNPELSFGPIAEVSWQVVEDRLTRELARQAIDRNWMDYDYALGGKSLGTSLSIAMAATKPEGVNISDLVLVQGTAYGQPKSPNRLRLDFVLPAMAKFNQYNGQNPYGANMRQDVAELGLGPHVNLVGNILKHPASHIGAVAVALARGGDKLELAKGLFRHSLYDTKITMLTGDKDKLADASEMVSAAAQMNRLYVVQGKSPMVEAVVWPGHYHSAMENLVNPHYVYRHYTK